MAKPASQITKKITNVNVTTGTASSTSHAKQTILTQGNSVQGQDEAEVVLVQGGLGPLGGN